MFGAVDYEQQDLELEREVEAVVVATGFAQGRPEALERFGFSRHPEVYTAFQFERMFSSNGPTEGAVVRRDGEAPGSAAIIHCVGREERGYCSSVCCQYALKFARYLASKIEGIRILELHRDLCLPGKAAQRFQLETWEKGVERVRYGELEVEDDEGRVAITVRNGSEEERRFTADLAILAPPMVPREGTGDLAALLTNLQAGDVLFVDEIHRLSPVVEEVLYPALEDFQIDIMIGEGPAARSIKLELPRFTLIGATTRAGLLTSPLRDRFGIVERLEFYSPEELSRIVTRSAGILQIGIDNDGAMEIARRSRGTPRIANRLLRRVRDYADVKGEGFIDQPIADAAMKMLRVDRKGFDTLDRRLLQMIIEHFDGGPVGVKSIAAALSEEAGTIEDVIEPYLIQQGYITRTAQGRVATARAYRHFGLEMKGKSGNDLFSAE